MDGVFYASLICERDKIEEIFDARTSDAIALALRFDAPIFTYDSILKKAGFKAALSAKENKRLSEDNWIQNFVTEQTKKNTIPKNLAKMSVEKLRDLLNKLVALEDYEQAVRVRDELSKRGLK